ncbi:MAG: pilus assembly protein PilM [Candidatus Komeilibacteria bacterium]|nr:pilus assembly protein PilM [Candidatus Komeilibacteria bacterium]
MWYNLTTYLLSGHYLLVIFFMGLFSHEHSYLGVDIGTSGVKVVQLRNNGGQANLETYGYVDMSVDLSRTTSPEIKAKVVSALTKIQQTARLTSHKAVAALPTFSVFNSIINLPAMNLKDVPQAVKWEAKKYVPLPLEEMILDWKILETKSQLLQLEGASTKSSFFGKSKEVSTAAKPAAPNNLNVLVTAAPKNLVNRYIEVFKAAHLELLSLETEAFALARSLLGGEKNAVLIVDIGSLNTDLCVIEKGVFILNRSLDIGGSAITQAIAQSLNITVDPGGSAFLPNLVNYLNELFNIPVIIGNPWHKVAYQEELKFVLEEIGSRFAVSIGLALRDIH